MGIRLKGKRYFEEILSVLKLDSCKGLSLCELGDLFMRKDTKFDYRRASIYFEQLGFRVVVIDLGIGTERIASDVLRCDLAKPIDLDEQFDFILDYGTGEHITDQYEFHRNIHNLCRQGGVIIRSNPSDRFLNETDWQKSQIHGIFHYTPEFFVKLAWKVGYKIIDLRDMTNDYWPRDPRRRNYLYVSMMKRKEREFPSREEFHETELELISVIKDSE